MNPAAVIPWAVEASGEIGACMEVAAWWLLYGCSPSFKVHSVMIPTLVEVVYERAATVVAEATSKAEAAQKRPDLLLSLLGWSWLLRLLQRLRINRKGVLRSLLGMLLVLRLKIRNSLNLSLC